MSKTRATASPVVKKPRKASTQPTREEIALRAYHIFLERGSTPGNELEDWIRAERELRQPVKPGRKSKVVSIAA